MKTRQNKLKVWVILETNGSVCTAHCTCMAGLGEVCSHIAAVLYAAEYAAGLKNSISCTDVKAAWPVPSQSGIQTTVVGLMDWGKKIDDKTCSTVPPMSQDDIVAMLEEIQNSNCQAALMRIVKPFSLQISKENITLPVVFNIYEKKNEKKPLEELISLGRSIAIEVGPEMAAEIEIRTQEQTKCEEWYRQRTGRITASIFKNVCTTSIENPSISLIKMLCYPQRISTPAMKWGIEHEKIAIQSYIDKTKEKHENFIINKVGLVVSTMWPQLGASPDGLVYCTCCCGGCLEVKCPFNLRENGSLTDYTKQKGSCLVTNKNNEVTIDKKHAYYFQVQAQIFICNVQYCDFVVWCPNFTFIQRVLPDFEFLKKFMDKALEFHAKVIMPELLGRYYTSRVPGGNITKWCFCNKIDDGRPMIKCCNENCDFSYFHMVCVNLKQKPETSWMCPRCNENICHLY